MATWLGIHVLPLHEELGAAYHADVNQKVTALWSGTTGDVKFGQH
jgi:hypothetical protein